MEIMFLLLQVVLNNFSSTHACFPHVSNPKSNLNLCALLHCLYVNVIRPAVLKSQSRSECRHEEQLWHLGLQFKNLWYRFCRNLGRKKRRTHVSTDFVYSFVRFAIEKGAWSFAEFHNQICVTVFVNSAPWAGLKSWTVCLMLVGPCCGLLTGMETFNILQSRWLLPEVITRQKDCWLEKIKMSLSDINGSKESLKERKISESLENLVHIFLIFQKFWLKARVKEFELAMKQIENSLIYIFNRKY